MQNPIQPCNLFATPDSMEDLEAYLMSFTGTERTVAMTAAMMAWNLAHKVVAENIPETA